MRLFGSSPSDCDRSECAESAEFDWFWVELVLGTRIGPVCSPLPLAEFVREGMYRSNCEAG